MEGHLDNRAFWNNPNNARAPKDSKDDSALGTMDYLQNDICKTWVYLLRACEAGGKNWTPKIGKGLLGKRLFEEILRVAASSHALLFNHFLPVVMTIRIAYGSAAGTWGGARRSPRPLPHTSLPPISLSSSTPMTCS
jgi:hypothetical protein